MLTSYIEASAGKLLSTDLGQSTHFYGVSVGPLSTLSHNVKGNVYIVDEKRIRIKNFFYDGQGPGSYFYRKYAYFE